MNAQNDLKIFDFEDILKNSIILFILHASPGSAAAACADLTTYNCIVVEKNTERRRGIMRRIVNVEQRE